MDEQTAQTLPTEVVIRPNGKPYRARSVRGCGWEDDELSMAGHCGVVVLGTNDLERAQVFADRLVPYWYDHEFVALNPEVGWYRKGYLYGKPTWVRDPDRGAAGVMFTANYPPEESS